MAPKKRNTSRGRPPKAPRNHRARVPTPPPREESVPVTETSNTFNVAQVGNLLQDFLTGFLATLTQAAPAQPEHAPPVDEETEQVPPNPSHNARATRARVAQPTPPTPNLVRNPPEVTPVIHVPDTNFDEMRNEIAQNTLYLAYRRDFNALKIKFFEGVKGPNEADSWLDLVEDELNNLRVPNCYRVSIATGRFTRQSA